MVLFGQSVVSASGAGARHHPGGLRPLPAALKRGRREKQFPEKDVGLCRCKNATRTSSSPQLSKSTAWELEGSPSLTNTFILQ